MFNLVKKKKDAPIVKADKEQETVAEVEKEEKPVAEEPIKEVKEEPKTSNIKIPAPTEVFTNLNLVSLEDYFACWFNEVLAKKISEGLTDYERTEHILFIKHVPRDFLDYKPNDGDYARFKPTLAKMLESSHFKPTEHEVYFMREIHLPWDNSNNEASYSKHNRLTDAYTLKKYELDDDVGFGKELTKLLFPENESNQVKRSKSNYHRTVTIKLSAFSPKYVHYRVLDNFHGTFKKTTLYPRYKNIIESNGWEVEYLHNFIRVTSSEELEKDYKDSDEPVVVLKDKEKGKYNNE